MPAASGFNHIFVTLPIRNRPLHCKGAAIGAEGLRRAQEPREALSASRTPISTRFGCGKMPLWPYLPQIASEAISNPRRALGAVRTM